MGIGIKWYCSHLAHCTSASHLYMQSNTDKIIRTEVTIPEAGIFLALYVVWSYKTSLCMLLYHVQPPRLRTAFRCTCVEKWKEGNMKKVVLSFKCTCAEKQKEMWRKLRHMCREMKGRDWFCYWLCRDLQIGRWRWLGHYLGSAKGNS